jgi:xanthine dehydrogenase accessory factor
MERRRYYHKDFPWLLCQGLDLETIPNELYLFTLLEVKGSAPQKVGAKMLSSEKGDVLWGTVGGGKLEAYLLQLTLNEKNFTPLRQITVNLQRDIGMSCGGEVSLLMECFSRKKIPRVYLFGAGHVAQEFVRLSLPLSHFSIQVFDPREEWLNKFPESPDLNLTILDYASKEKVAEVLHNVTPEDFIISLSMGHQFDRVILQAALATPARFIGVMGSVTKKNKLFSELGLEKDSMRITCPLGDETIDHHDPYTISLGLVVQILRLLKK